MSFFTGFIKSFKESENVICSFRGLANAYRPNCLNGLVEVSVGVIEDGDGLFLVGL